MAQNNPRKKVLFLITKATWGGAQRYVYDLVTHLSREQFEPVVAYGEQGKLSEKLNEKNIETHPLPSLGRDIALLSDVSSFFEIIACLRKVRPDVLHLNSSKAAALGALAARIIGVKRIIFTVHGWPFNEKRNEFARVMMYLISWLTAFLSHQVIVVSKSDEEQGKDMRWIKNKIHYIPIGIETPLFLSREEASASLSLPETPLRVGTIAELTPNKGLSYAIEAVSILKEQGIDVSYSIIGEGEERERLQTLTQELDVADSVSFKGFLPDASQYLPAFDVFLLPSVKEGMPYVLLEAAAAGIPIITTDVVNPDVIERLSNTRPVPPADPEAIAEALSSVLSKKKEAGITSTQNHFPLSAMLEKTTVLYT